MTERLAGKRCFITGASRGIGRAIAKAYVEQGAAVALAARSLPELESLSDTIEGKTYPIRCDVRKTSDIERGICKSIDVFDGIDVVVNNAGILEHGPLTELEDTTMERIIDVNLMGEIRVAREAMPHLIESEGNLINVSSQLGSVGVPDVSVYCSTKGGIDNLTRQLAVEYAEHRVNVNGLAPGVTQTEMTEPAMESDSDWEQRKLNQIPLNRLGTTEDMCGPAVFLASDESNYMTGHILVVDGGYLAQ